RARVAESGLDGAMIGRGMFGNPWFFSNAGGDTLAGDALAGAGGAPSLREKLLRMIAHTELFEKLYHSDKTKREGKLKNFEVMKKHFKAYCSGFDGAKELRIALMET